MTVATMIKKLEKLPHDLEVMIEVSQGVDKKYVFTSPEQVSVSKKNGEKFVFIYSDSDYEMKVNELAKE